MDRERRKEGEPGKIAFEKCNAYLSGRSEMNWCACVCVSLMECGCRCERFIVRMCVGVGVSVSLSVCGCRCECFVERVWV